MKANELRIGNLVLRNDEIDIVSIWHLQMISKGDNYLKPVPLSEELLLKFGFLKDNHYSGFTLDRFRFFWKTQYKYWYVVDAYSKSYLTKIEFVHELQNFIFAMNSQELVTPKLLRYNIES